MANKIIPIDVIRAGTRVYFSDINLNGYRRRECDTYQLYKLIKTETNAIVTLNYNMKFQYFSVRVSVPKLLYGTNTREVSLIDVDKFITAINEILKKENLNLDFSDFRISILELCHNYICSTEKDKIAYLDFFSKASVSRKKKDNYPSSTVFKNSQSRITIYNKSQELSDRKSNTTLTEDVQKILRTEFTLQTKALKQYHKNLTVDAFFKDFDLRSIFLAEQHKAGFGLKILHKKTFFKILNKKIQKRRKDTRNKIRNFYREFNLYGEDFVRGKYSQYQVREYKKIITDMGFSPIYINNTVKIIDFTSLDESKKIVKMNVKELLKQYTLRKASLNLSLYFRCSFFQMVFKYWDTS